MSGSSLDGLDIVHCELEEYAGKWNYQLLNSFCHQYDNAWKEKLKHSPTLNALEYQLLHCEFGHYLGKRIVEFIKDNALEHQVHFIACHGHTTFHLPGNGLTHQLGEGASIASETGLPVIADLRMLDVALGGQGAPIVPIGEMLLFANFKNFLNLGGIANISINKGFEIIAYDVCPANKVLNMLAENRGYEYDDEGRLAQMGNVNFDLLDHLNNLDYYKKGYPKSLANSFGTEIVYPIIKSYSLSEEDSLRTFVRHIVFQIHNALKSQYPNSSYSDKLFVTGGGAFNKFLIEELESSLKEIMIEVYLPEKNIINYKEALIIALMGALRWREQNNVMKSVTGSLMDNCGGALWLGAKG